MKKTMISSAVLATVLFAAPAAAQEKNFSGFTVTALGGFDAVRLKDVDTGYKINKDGFTYGGAVGYDYTVGSVVVGAEGELTGTTAVYRATLSGVESKIKVGRDLYAGVRIGVPVASNILLYGKAGYTNARLKASVSGGGVSFSEGTNFDGYRLGAGAEVKYGQIFGRLEYRYSDYGSKQGLDLGRNQVLAGIGYRF
ncbi:MAG TPA: outer membrane beta-barrel protein [Sphingobium sp.]|uniref:outer membrane protein n=1 Tax=Sphingobium sp. TaxID=1912891 RepID=UPI002ED02B2A